MMWQGLSYVRDPLEQQVADFELTSVIGADAVRHEAEPAGHDGDDIEELAPTRPLGAHVRPHPVANLVSGHRDLHSGMQPGTPTTH